MNINTKYIAGAKKFLQAAKEIIAELEKTVDEIGGDVGPVPPESQSRRTKILRTLKHLARPALTPSGEVSGFLNEVIDAYIKIYGTEDDDREHLSHIISAYLSQLIKRGYVGRKHGRYYLTYEGMKLPYT